MSVPNMAGRTVLVTGGNAGIGRETAAALAAAGASVAITARDAAKGAAAASYIAGSTSREVPVVSLDLASLDSVRKAAADVLDRFPTIDVLVNNAGAIIGDRRTTVEGFELTFGANHLGPFLLTQLLLDRLVASKSRVVNVASTAHRQGGALDFDDLQLEHGFNAMRAYGRSKLANILFTKELARRQAGTGLTTFAVHPGGVNTEFGEGGDTKGVMAIVWKAIGPIMLSPTSGAGPSVYCASEPGLETKSGGYFQRRIGGQFGPVVESQPNANGRDMAAAKRLWDVSEELIASVS